MAELRDEEKFIIDLIAQNNNIMSYKDIQKECEDKFEGVRLILKSLKSKGYVTFEGNIPSFNAEIELIKKY
ncbi:MAG: hypothetical protein ACTSRZ_21235 [Promethearchaeota archaeon]